AAAPPPPLPRATARLPSADRDCTAPSRPAHAAGDSRASLPPSPPHGRWCNSRWQTAWKTRKRLKDGEKTADCSMSRIVDKSILRHPAANRKESSQALTTPLLHSRRCGGGRDRRGSRGGLRRTSD